jgi:hypothetical protein
MESSYYFLNKRYYLKGKNNNNKKKHTFGLIEYKARPSVQHLHKLLPEINHNELPSEDLIFYCKGASQPKKQL